MASIICDPAVEDVLKGVLSQEQIAQYSHLTTKLTVRPKPPQLGNGVNVLFPSFELIEDLVIGKR